jgi:membrane protein
MDAMRLFSRLAAAAIGGVLVIKAIQTARTPPESRALRASPKTAAKPDPENVVEAPHSAGRDAVRPWNIPWAGWTAILKRTYVEFAADRVMAVAAGVTFYALLAVFPAIAAFVSLYGLVADRATLVDHIGTLEGVVPEGGVTIVAEQLARLTQGNAAALGFGFLFSLGLALWSANAGIKAVFDALNVAYDEDESRGFFRLNIISLSFTAGALVFLLLGLGATAAVPLALAWFGLEGVGPLLLAALRWPALLIVAVLALSVLYRFGPSRADARWEWLTPGSLFAGLAWIGMSVGFSWYAANFASYNETYGTLGAVIGLMTWMWLSAAIVLFGAEFNAESERQTAEDSTTGPPRPRGMRGAVVADDVASG